MPLDCEENAALETLLNSSAPKVKRHRDARRYSKLFCLADFDSGQSEDKHGNMGAFQRDAQSARWRAEGDLGKARRIAWALNRFQKLGAQGKIAFDLEDARQLGTPGYETAGPVFTYCRRPDAVNCFLMPLAQYHQIGHRYFPDGAAQDNRAFADKRPEFYWRGAFSGRAYPDSAQAISAKKLRALLSAQENGRISAQMATDLAAHSRFRLVSDYGAHARFDMGFTLNDADQQLFHAAGLAHLLRPRRPQGDAYQYKYLLSVRGNDTGSNFLPALNSNSVVLKEEEDWVLFYSGLFHPWEQYIPLAPGLSDLEEKADWAMRHERECIEISRRARDACRHLWNYRVRAAFLQELLARYQAAGGAGDMRARRSLMGMISGMWRR